MVARETLGDLTILGSGGQGTVYAVPPGRIPGGAPAAYKEYAVGVRDSLDVAALLALIRLRTPAVAGRIDETAAWPADVVRSGEQVTGFLMARAPGRFHTAIELPSGRVRRLAQLQLLLNDEDYLYARSLAIDDRFRLEFLHDVARGIETLHGLGIVVGDLSPANLLFSREARPRCFFLDCDAMRLRGASVLDPVETADWQAPEGEDATAATDSYKVALLCARLFAGDQSVRIAPPVDRIGAPLRRLVVRGLSEDPRVRPGMGEWRRTLAAARPRRRSRPAARPRRRWALRAAAVLVLVAASVVPVRGVAHRVQDLGASWGGPRAGAFEQASGMARLLYDSGRSRARLDAAVAGVRSCRDVWGAADELRSVLAERRTQLERTADLGVDLLPRGVELRSRVTAALGLARRAANSYAGWAAEVGRAGCASPAMRGAGRRTGDAAARGAEAAWDPVAELWNSMADSYRHPRVTAQEL